MIQHYCKETIESESDAGIVKPMMAADSSSQMTNPLTSDIGKITKYCPSINGYYDVISIIDNWIQLST